MGLGTVGLELIGGSCFINQPGRGRVFSFLEQWSVLNKSSGEAITRQI